MVQISDDSCLEPYSEGNVNRLWNAPGFSRKYAAGPPLVDPSDLCVLEGPRGSRGDRRSQGRSNPDHVAEMARRCNIMDAIEGIANIADHSSPCL